jgi:AraC family transcriptional regulator, regulatory protein of adaptative response / methylated-DNA-[protein]-cysteine methyltransferase
MNLTTTKSIVRSAIPIPAKFLTYALADCELGAVLVARSANGVCSILLGENAEELTADLASRFPGATLLLDGSALEYEIAGIQRYLRNPSSGLSLKLDMGGTPFQRRVWEKLRTISPGRTLSYRELARRVSSLANPRAVASACAANPIALAIPCHRVVRSYGDLAGYRWGIERKRALIQKEAMA